MRCYSPGDRPLPAFVWLPTWEDRRRRRWILLGLFVAIVVWGLTDVRRRARVDSDNPTVHKTDVTVYTEAGAAFFDGRDPYLVTNPRGWHYLYPPLFAILVAPLAALDSQSQAVVWYFLSVAACFGTWYECRRLWRHLLMSARQTNRGCNQSAPEFWLPLGALGPLSARTSKGSEGGIGEGAGLGAASTRAPQPRPGVISSQTGIGIELASPPVWLAWLAAATVALPTLNCLQRGQVGVMLVYLLLIGLRLVIVSRKMRGVFLGGIVLALAATIKLTPVLPVGLLAMLLLAMAWRARHSYVDALADSLARGPFARALAVASGQIAGLVLFVVVIPGLVLGHENNLSHLETWVRRVAANDEVGRDNDFNVYSKRNQSLSNAVRRLGNRIMFAVGWGPDDQSVDVLATEHANMPMDVPVVDRLVQLFAAGAVVLLLLAGWRVAGRDDVAGVAAVFGLGCMATLVVSPLSWGHHYVMWLPGLLFVPHWLWRNNRRAQAIAMAEAACVLVVAHYLLLDHAGRVGLLGIGSAIWYVVGTVCVGWPAGDRQEECAATPTAQVAESHERLRRAA